MNPSPLARHLTFNSSMPGRSIILQIYAKASLWIHRHRSRLVELLPVQRVRPPEHDLGLAALAPDRLPLPNIRRLVCHVHLLLPRARFRVRTPSAADGSSLGRSSRIGIALLRSLDAAEWERSIARKI
jgi:hypothetical protein